MTEKTIEWYQKELGDRFQHFYMQLDGSYNFPNSLEGDLLRMTHNMLTLMEKEKSTPSFAVGEYYSDGKVIYKVLEIEEYPDTKEVGLAVLALYSGDLYEDTYEIDFPCEDKPATAEQIVTFHRAEQFAKHGRKLDEFRDRDIVKYEGELFFAKTTSESNLISVSGFDGYGWEDMNADEFELIQTAEELQEVENND
ncbi:hypothetical protein [Enterococcus sp. AZ177]|uniref:hypothetical protein n=1 Tax=unclassified Enterococcus TaxID=2608891 RepID=UPI003D2FD80D